jgi:hypothetical protein
MPGSNVGLACVLGGLPPLFLSQRRDAVNADGYERQRERTEYADEQRIEALCERLRNREKMTSRMLLQHSVQIRRKRIETLGLAEICGNRSSTLGGAV